MLALLLVAHLYASIVVVIEMPDDDARPVFIRDVVDCDTVELADRRVRLVGYDAFELSEPLGALARQELRSLLRRRGLCGAGAPGCIPSTAKTRNKRALFYTVFALEETFGVYKSALREYAQERGKVVEKREVGEGPFKKAVYMLDVGRLAQLAKEESRAFKDVLKVLRERLNEYAVKYGLGDLLDVKEDVTRRLAEAVYNELSEFNDVGFGVKALVALIAYREHALGRRGAFGIAAWYWLEVGGSAWLLYYAPITAYNKTKRAKAERPAAVEEMAAEGLRRPFLKPGADRYRGLVEELTKIGKLALMLEKKTESSYMFRLFKLEEGGGLKELGVRLKIAKVGEGERTGIAYALTFDDMENWWGFFGQELEAAKKAAGEAVRRLPVEDRLPYMVGWVNSDVTISKGLLEMGTTHLWQLAETHALFDWSYVTMYGVGLTLEGLKPQFYAHTSLEKFNNTIRRSAKDGWLKMLGIKAESWEGLKQWVAGHWDVVVDAAVRRLGEEVRGELEALREMLNDDKVAREVLAQALLLIQEERLGVNEATLKYFAAVASGAVGGDGYLSAAMGVVGLTSGERVIALLWVAALAVDGIEAEVRGTGRKFDVVTSGGAVKLASRYFLYGPLA
jgi:hypothetical protein